MDAAGEQGEQGDRWALEQVLALAPKATAVAPSMAIAVPSSWSHIGCDAQAVWGRYRGAAAEPYEVVVDHVEVAVGCGCPSRAVPCKHALALLVMWSKGQVPADQRPARSSRLRVQRLARLDAQVPTPTAHDVGRSGDSPEVAAAPTVDPDRQRDDGVERMAAGLVELDRWVLDRLRAGLADPALARSSTWEAVAARLTDAQVPALANRLRRIGARVGVGPAWHEHLLADLGAVHLLATAGLHLRELPEPLADGVATALGWQVRQADVMAGVPVSDRWLVAGCSDTREDRIEVRRVWLWGQRTRSWAMALSFAAYGQSLDESMQVGTVTDADLFRYPGAVPLRALVGQRRSTEPSDEAPPAATIAEACEHIGRTVAAEPWIERLPFSVQATVVATGGHDRTQWSLGDRTGSLPLDGSRADLATVAAGAAGAPVTLTCEWTPLGIVALTVHLADRALAVGPDHQLRAA